MSAHETTSHRVIRHWAEARGFWPACVKGSPERIRLGGSPWGEAGEELDRIDWSHWLAVFERRQLQLIYDPAQSWYTLGSRKPPGGG